MIVLLYHQDKIIGAFDNLELCTNFVKSVEKQGWASGFKIINCKNNSCLMSEEEEITITKQSNEDIIEVETKTETSIDSRSKKKIS